MNYITQIKGFWMLHEKHELNATDTALYFYLLEICNSANWVNPFKRNTAKIMADLKISRSSLERSRKRLRSAGIIKYKSVNGTANTTYQLTNLETTFKNRFKGDEQDADQGIDQSMDKGTNQLNKNNKPKPKPKQAVVVSCEQAFAFYAETRNNRLIKDRWRLDNNQVRDLFRTFYDSKIDLGDLNNKTIEEIARNFYYWLPKHLAAKQKEKSSAKKERSAAVNHHQPQRGFAAAIKFTGVTMREDI